MSKSRIETTLTTFIALQQRASARAFKQAQRNVAIIEQSELDAFDDSDAFSFTARDADSEISV